MDEYKKATIRTVAVFVGMFLLFTAADHATTLKALSMGYVELNEHTDFSSMYSLVIPEVMGMLIGCVSIGAGLMLRRGLLASHTLSSDEFSRIFMSGKNVLCAGLVLVPLVVAAGRFFVVVNNLGLIAFGWGFMELPQRLVAEALDASPKLVDVAANSIVMVLLMKPMTRLVWYMTYSTRS
jgi:hypothetical protein